MVSDSLIHAAAGAAGGIVAMSATYPLIFLSTRSAVEAKASNKSTYEAVLDIVTREGFLGLYSGLGSSLLGVAVSNGVYYYFYERSKGALSARGGAKALTTLESILAGLIAGSATTIISNPIWVVQTSQATRTVDAPSSSTPVARPMGFVETIEHILRKGGIGAFWRGIGPALVLVINPVLQYTVFEQLKNIIVRRRLAKLNALGPSVKAASAVLSDLDYFILGAVSKLIATGSTYPYIVVKSRLHAGSAHALRYKSSFDGLLTIAREEGIEGLYKGVGSKLLQSVLMAAILFMGQRRIYEITKKALTPLAK